MKILHHNHLTDSYTTIELHPEADIYTVDIFGEKCFYYPFLIHRNRLVYELRHHETGMFLCEFAGRRNIEYKFVRYWKTLANIEMDKHLFTESLTSRKAQLASEGIVFPINTYSHTHTFKVDMNEIVKATKQFGMPCPCCKRWP